jgi:uncharacterized RDD family membrane protein YckC
MKTEPNIGNRILAGLIDYTLIYLFTFTMVFVLGEPNEEGVYSLTGAPSLIPILFWLIMTVGIEIGWGATLGNSIAGLRAIPLSGQNRKLTFGQSLKRHLLDPVDMFFFGLPGIITIKNTDKNQRIGDLWAKTIVVKESKLNELQTE